MYNKLIILTHFPYSWVRFWLLWKICAYRSNRSAGSVWHGCKSILKPRCGRQVGLLHVWSIVRNLLRNVKCDTLYCQSENYQLSRDAISYLHDLSDLRWSSLTSSVHLSSLHDVQINGSSNVLTILSGVGNLWGDFCEALALILNQWLMVYQPSSRNRILFILSDWWSKERPTLLIHVDTWPSVVMVVQYYHRGSCAALDGWWK